MPVVFRERGYRFFFYSNEGTPREPPHIHIKQGELEAKFWLRPNVMMAYNDGYSPRTLWDLLGIVERNREKIERAWMSTSARAASVRFDDYSMWVDLSDGRVLGVPLAWFPRLAHGTAEQRHEVEISPRGLHWESLDEDISIAGLLAGVTDQTSTAKELAV